MIAIATWLNKATSIMQQGISKVDNAKRQVERLLKSKAEIASAAETEVAIRIAALREQEASLATRVLRTSELVKQLEVGLDDLRKKATLKHFLSERTKADDYRKHLGLVATVRGDFEKLERLIGEQDSSDQSSKSVDRIILYIDDLDRCPAAKVVEVLQAVHLLLAYPLFVVVVGVDSRWLMHSLTSHYRQLGGEVGSAKTDWKATPQHYLEKIFQISFALKPMNRQGFAKLIGQLLGGGTDNQIRDSSLPASQPQSLVNASGDGSAKAPSGATPVKPADSDPENGLVGNARQGMAGRQGRRESTASETADGLGQSLHDVGASEQPDVNFMVDEDAMVVQPWEASFAEALYEFIPSPRAAKRLSNIYRILKAGLMRDELAAFEGNQESPGEFQVPLLLLAIMINAPDSAEVVFGALLSEKNERADIVDVTENCALEEQTRSTLVEKISSITVRPGFPKNPELFRFWVPRVARFSFGMSQFTFSTG